VLNKVLVVISNAAFAALCYNMVLVTQPLRPTEAHHKLSDSVRGCWTLSSTAPSLLR
jgi:hypothetical protein